MFCTCMFSLSGVSLQLPSFLIPPRMYIHWDTVKLQSLLMTNGLKCGWTSPTPVVQGSCLDIMCSGMTVMQTSTTHQKVLLYSHKFCPNIKLNHYVLFSGHELWEALLSNRMFSRCHWDNYSISLRNSCLLIKSHDWKINILTIIVNLNHTIVKSESKLFFIYI